MTEEKLCCSGNCRLAAIQQMDREQLMDALVNAEESLSMALAYVDDLESGDA